VNQAQRSFRSFRIRLTTPQTVWHRCYCSRGPLGGIFPLSWPNAFFCIFIPTPPFPRRRGSCAGFPSFPFLSLALHVPSWIPDASSFALFPFSGDRSGYSYNKDPVFEAVSVSSVRVSSGRAAPSFSSHEADLVVLTKDPRRRADFPPFSFFTGFSLRVSPSSPCQPNNGVVFYLTF